MLDFNFTSDTDGVAHSQNLTVGNTILLIGVISKAVIIQLLTQDMLILLLQVHIRT